MTDEPISSGLLWDHPAHRAARHAILRRYLSIWLASFEDTDHGITFIDGSAGPDEYEGGEPGSPLVALEVAHEHGENLASRDIRFIFVEEDIPRAARLERTLNARDIPANIKTTVRAGTFETAMRRLFEDLGDAQMAPTLVMVDPFGVAGVPFDVMKQLAKQPNCDLLVTCMPATLSRWSETNEQAGGHVDRMFGGPQWRALSLVGQVDLYRTNLQTAGFTHTSPFQMVNQGTNATYHLIAATHDARGLAVAKRAFRASNTAGEFSFEGGD